MNCSFLQTLLSPLRWIQCVLTNITLKVAKSPLHFLIHNVVFQPDSFSNNLNTIMLDFMQLGTRRCKGDSFNGRPHLNFFHSTFTLDFLFQENKRETVREIRLEYMHRGQTYLTASHSQLPYLCYFFHQRAGWQKQWLACRCPPPPSSLARGLAP